MKTRAVPIVAIVAFIAAGAGAQTRPGTQNAEALLKGDGLVRMGGLYVLPMEQKLDEQVRAARKAKAQFEIQNGRRMRIQQEIERANKLMNQWSDEYDAANRQMARTRKDDVDRYNALVGQVNGLMNRIRQGVQFVQQREQDLAKLSASPDDYIDLAVDLAERLEAADQRYAALAADPQVQAALAALNAQETIKVKLGPSALFTAELPRWRHVRSLINLEVVNLDIRHGVPEVEVTLNGTLKEPMVFDSGAATVSLTAEVAKKLGLTPRPGDPTVQMSTADGSVVQATVMQLKSVRLARFTVENVTCTVLPESAHNASCLLGGTFLRHFVYRADLNARVLHLAQLAGEPGSAQVTPPTPIAAAPRSADQPTSTGPATVSPATTTASASGPATTTPAGDQYVPPTGLCKLLAGGGVCLAIPASSRDPGRGSMMWTTMDNVEDQQWTIAPADHQCVTLRNKNSGLLLGVQDAAQTDNPEAVQATASNGADQEWTIEPTLGHLVRIVNRKNGLCLTSQGSGGVGSGVILAPWDQSLNQLWQIEPIHTEK